MKVFITKYALTMGVFEVESSVIDNWQTVCFKPPGQPYSQYLRRGDWHPTHAEAIAMFEAMRTTRLKSLRKSIAKLEALDLTKTVAP